jgi:hypothetical protein
MNKFLAAQKRDLKQREQSRKCRHNTTELKTKSDLWQRNHKDMVEEKKKPASSINCAGKTVYLHVEDWN